MWWVRPAAIMDQVAVVSGTAKAVLPILCRPASVADPVALPAGLEIVGWPTGAAHTVGGVPYGRARAAAFMGKRMVEGAAGRTWPWVSQLPRAAVEALPDLLEGRAFLEEWGETDDDVTSVRPDETYPVRAATLFGVEEHVRAVAALTALRDGEPERLGPLMEASQDGYDAMGLGHPSATAIVKEALARPGVLGARSSGGGCGGTVVVLCAQWRVGRRGRAHPLMGPRASYVVDHWNGCRVRSLRCRRRLFRRARTRGVRRRPVPSSSIETSTGPAFPSLNCLACSSKAEPQPHPRSVGVDVELVDPAPFQDEERHEPAALVHRPMCRPSESPRLRTRTAHLRRRGRERGWPGWMPSGHGPKDRRRREHRPNPPGGSCRRALVVPPYQPASSRVTLLAGGQTSVEGTRLALGREGAAPWTRVRGKVTSRNWSRSWSPGMP